MSRPPLKSFLLIIFGALIMPVLSVGCGSNRPNETEIIYLFSTSGENCEGISFGWVNEAVEMETCHRLFTDGDVEVDCPVPESVTIVIDNSNELDRLSNASSYISVSKTSACTARCEIWISGNLSVSAEILTIEDEHIATCRARIN